MHRRGVWLALFAVLLVGILGPYLACHREVQGFRVLRYDHFGRGYSRRPEMDYDRALYKKQLEDLLSALDIEGPRDTHAALGDHPKLLLWGTADPEIQRST